MLHLVLTFKMRTAGVVCPHPLDDRQSTLGKLFLKRLQHGMQPITIVQTNGGRTPAPWRLDADGRPGPVVHIVRIRHHEVHRVCPAPEENAHQSVLAGLIHHRG